MDGGSVRGFLESSAGEWIAILSLVFGGCCSNVWALEAVLKEHPNAGTFLTFAQFIYVTIQTVSTQLYFPKPAESVSNGPNKSESSSNKNVAQRWGLRLPRIRKRKVPIRRWMVQVIFFLGVSLMNNFAFGLHIPVTVHIIFRSGGLCVSMLTGWWFAGRKYSVGQVLAGLIITTGIVLATISAPRPRRSLSSENINQTAKIESNGTSLMAIENLQYLGGIGLLSAALFLSAWMGIFQEETYRQYGKQWKEGLFYSHFLSLPFFIPMYPTLSSTFQAYLQTPPITLLHIPTPSAITSFLSLPNIVNPIPIPDKLGRTVQGWKALMVPSAIVALGINVVTQGLCVRGVNRLTSRVNSTTVNLVLTLRKALSLAISVWYYGSGFTTGLAVGGGMVLGGTVLYSIAPSPVIVSNKKVQETSTAGGQDKFAVLGDRVDGSATESVKVTGREQSSSSNSIHKRTFVNQKSIS